MPIYKQTTEITNIDKVWANINKDIVEVYFGDKNVFTVWAELESPLPITILAAGKDLIDYRIYGNTVGGESVGERTENLFTDTGANSGYLTSDGVVHSPHATLMYTDYIEIPTGTEYLTQSFIMVYDQMDAPSMCFYDSTKTFISGEKFNRANPKTFEVPQGAKYLRTCYRNTYTNIMLTEGSTAPTSYIPFGYKLPMVVRSNNLVDEEMSRGYFTNADFALSSGNTVYKYRSIKVRLTTGSYALRFGEDVYLVREIIDGVYSEESFTTKMYAFTCTEDGYVGFSFRNSSNTNWNKNPTTMEVVQMETVPIYIGSDPLAEDEYVDFGEQKIYRKVNGILTPTDPPVPIPALPTIQGETVIDYNPSTTPAVEPEKMYVKYRKQGT